MRLDTAPYREQAPRWPARGRHILAQFDDESIVVYQAYRPSIGTFAAEHQRFEGGGFSLARMSWIKTSFLWMMHRSGWGAKAGQEVVLAVRLRRRAFDGILRDAVHSTFVPEVYGSRGEWERAVDRSSVRLQWDPDHAPDGARQERRAIQLGLRGAALVKYAREWIVSIEDISGFVREQREARGSERLRTPREEPYVVADPAVAARLQLGKITR